MDSIGSDSSAHSCWWSNRIFRIFSRQKRKMSVSPHSTTPLCATPSFLPIRRVQRPLDFLFVALEKKRMQRRGVLACAVAAAILVPTHAALGRSDSDSPASTEGRCSPRMSPTASGAPQVRERRETTRVRELSLSAQGSPLTDRTLPSPISPRVDGRKLDEMRVLCGQSGRLRTVDGTCDVSNVVVRRGDDIPAWKHDGPERQRRERYVHQGQIRVSSWS